MKKLVSLILCLAIALAWLPAGSPFASAAGNPLFAGGSGTAEDPYLVSTPEQLEQVSNYSSSHFLQINDIYMKKEDGKYKDPITRQVLGQGGVYDGGGHCIANLLPEYQFDPFDPVFKTGLFSSNSGTIRNLTLVEPFMDCLNSSVEGDFTVKSCGILVDQNKPGGRVENCSVIGLEITNSYGGRFTESGQGVLHQSVGALVGENEGVISNCVVTGRVESSFSFRTNDDSTQVLNGAGGIAGWNRESGIIENCYSAVDTHASGSLHTISRAGALCGVNDGSIRGSCWDGTAYTYNNSKEEESEIAVGSGEGSVEAQQMAISQELISKLNEQSGEPFWGMDESGTIQMNARTLGVSASIPSGVYDMSEEVTLTLEGAPEGEIWYTVPGQTGEKQRYTEPITLTDDTELLVWGQVSNSVYQVSYYAYRNLRYPVRADMASGIYDGPIQVRLSTTLDNAKIYYTIDGTEPTEFSSEYTKDSPSLRIYGTTTVKAVAVVDGVYGDVMTYDYVISPPITVEPGSGDYIEPVDVTMSVRAGYDIYYTLDGSDPRTNGQKYEAPVTISKTTQLKVAAFRDGGWGEVETFSYQYSPVTITATPDEGVQKEGVRVELDCNVDYAQLSYQLSDGQEQPYDGPVDIIRSTTLTAYARHNGQLLATETFTYEIPYIDIQATPRNGSYKGIQVISLSCNWEGAELYYGLDDLNREEFVRYTGPFELDHSATLWVETRMWGRSVDTRSFVYTLDLPQVTASPQPGNLKAPMEVTLSIQEEYQGGYDIYYTLDGSDPKTNGIKYEAPIPIDKPVTTVIRAVPRSIDFDDDWGTSSQFRYTFSTQTLKVEDVTVEKKADYEVTALLSNTTLDTRTVDVYAAVYQDGRMEGVAMEQVTLPSGTRRQSVTVHYPYDSNAQLPDDAEIKVFCLDSETREPCCDVYRFSAEYVPVKQVLDYITVEPTSIVGEAGGTAAWPVITAHYTNGKADKVTKPTDITLLTHDRNIVHGEKTDGVRTLVFGKEGSTTLVFSYREGSIEREVVAQVTVVTGTRNLGFLANPTSEPLPEDAIPISNAQELAALSDTSDGANTAGKTYYLTNDIQLTGEWEPIRGFQGTLDGRGHTVSGLYISYSSNKQLAGLFGSAYDAVIKNLAVEIDSRGICAYNIEGELAYAGGLVGHSKNTDFINCYTTGGPVSGEGSAPYAGGLVGWLMNGPENRVVNCFSTCAVSSEATWMTQALCIAGGLIGELESGSGEKKATVSRCYAAGDVSVHYGARCSIGSAGIQAGGLVGKGNLLEISDCFAMGNVSIEHGNADSDASLIAGGLGGWLIDTELTRCYASGNVTADAPYGATCTSYIGGLTAIECTRDKCYVVMQKVSGTGGSNPVIDLSGTPVFEPNKTSSYYGFDSIDTWDIAPGIFQGLPYLQYQD